MVASYVGNISMASLVPRATPRNTSGLPGGSRPFDCCLGRVPWVKVGVGVKVAVVVPLAVVI